jgi:hypothetical protein
LPRPSGNAELTPCSDTTAQPDPPLPCKNHDSASGRSGT